MSDPIPLLHLVSDLVRSKELQVRFVGDPVSMLEEYEVLEPDRSTFLTMDIAKITKRITEQLTNYHPSIFPEDPDFLAEDGGVDPKYPTPRPGFFRIKPAQIDAAAVNAKPSGSFELLIYGQSFHDAQILIERTSDSKTPALAFEVALGTYRCSLLRAVVGPVAGEQGFKVGDQFKISVVNQKNSTTQKETFVYPANLIVV